MEGVPKVDGCAVVRSGPDLIRVFGEDAALLRQNAQNCTFVDRAELVESFEKSVARIGRLVPGALSKSARRAKFLTRFLMGRELERMWSEGVGKVGAYYGAIGSRRFGRSTRGGGCSSPPTKIREN